MLPTSLVGSEYITFPSLPLNPDAIDAFSMVAVHNNTVIAVKMVYHHRSSFNSVIVAS